MVKGLNRNVQDKDRAIAMDRAFHMSILFKEPYYSAIMDALYLYSSNDPKAMEIGKEKFDKTCLVDLKFGAKPTAWLWNYLKEFNKETADWEPPTAQINVNW